MGFGIGGVASSVQASRGRLSPVVAWPSTVQAWREGRTSEMSTDRVDIADLVAKLDALEKEATPGEWGILGWAGEHDEAGATVGAIASRAVVARTGGDGGSYYRPASKQYHANPALIAELRYAYPELRCIVVRAKEYVEARLIVYGDELMGGEAWNAARTDMYAKHEALVSAVRGEA